MDAVTDTLAFLRQAALVTLDIEAALRDTDLGVDHWRALAFVETSPGCSMAEVIDALVIPPTSATRTIDALVEMGAVFRAPAQHDRRRVTLRLSVHGAALLRKTEPAVLRINLKYGPDLDVVRD
ncbi:MAG: MarR family transcriptional regulator [Actinobacteria bacterium]|nr:MarR family transcriptional regulator [Actinomycetota bacterium]